MRNFAPKAQTDLDEIVGWLLDHGSSANVAERLLTAVLEAAARLAERPLLGRRRTEVLPDPFRIWSIPLHRLLIVYRAEPENMIILRVLRTDRDLGPIFADLIADVGDTNQS